jgi:HAMP domain-containing protein
MERLRLPAKVALVVASLLLPLVLLTLMAMQNLLHTRQLAVREQEGVRISELVLPVALQLNRHRDLTFRVLDGEIKAEAPRTEARRDLLAALQALDTAVSDGRLSYSLADEWQPVATQIRALAAGQHPDKPYDAAQLHSLAGQALQRLQLLNGERSDLILTPEARSYHLVDVLINSALPTLDTASRLRGLGSVLLQGKDAVHPPAAMAEIVSQSRMVANDVADIQRKFAALERAGDQMPGSWPQAMARLLEMGSLAEAAFVNGKPVDAAGFQEVGNSAIALANAMLGDTHRRLAQELLRQQQTAEYDLLLAAAAAAAGLLLLAYLMLVFTINVHGTLGALRKGTHAIARGDLAHRVRLRGRDEL